MVLLLFIQRYFLVIGDFKDKFYLLFYVYEIFIGCLSGYHMCDWWPWKPERVSGALELESWFMWATMWVQTLDSYLLQEQRKEKKKVQNVGEREPQCFLGKHLFHYSWNNLWFGIYSYCKKFNSVTHYLFIIVQGISEVGEQYADPVCRRYSRWYCH